MAFKDSQRKASEKKKKNLSAIVKSALQVKELNTKHMQSMMAHLNFTCTVISGGKRSVCVRMTAFTKKRIPQKLYKSNKKKHYVQGG